MRRSLLPLALAGATLALAACEAGSPAGAPTAAATCDRDCLIGVVEEYVASLAADDPATAPLAEGVVIVENLAKIQPGDGLWGRTTAAPTTFRIVVPDPVAQAVGYMGVMEVEGKPAIVALRLQLEDGRIVEAEHITAALREEGIANLQAPRPAFAEEIPPAERLRRDQLVTIAGGYYDALVGENGKLARFHPDCMRQENGIRVTLQTQFAGTDSWHRSYTCEAQLDTGVMAYLDALDNRRVFAADPVTGLVMGLSHFRHAMTQKVYPITGVPGVTERTVDLAPFDLPAAHVFKVVDGGMREIEAMGYVTGLHSPTGWE